MPKSFSYALIYDVAEKATNQGVKCKIEKYFKETVFTDVGDNRKSVKDPDFPMDCIAKMRMDFSDDQYIGTGFLVEKYIFFTAGHNIVDEDTGIATNVTLQFGINGSNPATIEIKVQGKDFTMKKDYSEVSETDMAWIDLSKYRDEFDKLPKKPFSIDGAIDYFSSDIDAEENTHILCGYPGDLQIDASYPYEVQTPVIQDGNLLLYKAATQGGNSGSPVFRKTSDNQWVVDGIHVGIHSPSTKKFESTKKIYYRNNVPYKKYKNGANCAVWIGQIWEGLDQEGTTPEATLAELQNDCPDAADKVASNQNPNSMKGNNIVQHGGGTINNRNQGIGYVSGTGHKITGYREGGQDTVNDHRSAGVMAGDNAKFGNLSGIQGGSKNTMQTQQPVSEGAEDVELKTIMESSEISHLYGKFSRANVKAAIIWDLDDEMLDKEIKLTKIEKLSYNKAQKQHLS